MESITSAPEREGRARFEQRFLPRKLPGASCIDISSNSDPGNFAVIVTATLAAEGNPWTTLGHAWKLCRTKALKEYSGIDGEVARGKMRNVWRKAVNGYGLMEQRPIKKK
jgi:hypothetical protein